MLFLDRMENRSSYLYKLELGQYGRSRLSGCTITQFSELSSIVLAALKVTMSNKCLILLNFSDRAGSGEVCGESSLFSMGWRKFRFWRLGNGVFLTVKKTAMYLTIKFGRKIFGKIER